MQFGKKLLRIAIPTYGRTSTVIEQIDGLLQSRDLRFYIHCNSNGYDHILSERYRASKRVLVTHFPENLGLKKNLKYLFESGKDNQFTLLMSDEDFLDLERLPEFLDRISRLDKAVSFMICSVNGPSGGIRYECPKWLGGDLFGLQELVTVCPATAYISGLCISNNHLSLIDLSTVFDGGVENAYPHILLLRRLALVGAGCFYHDPLVRKGKDVMYGGEGYSHRKSKRGEAKVQSNLDLNPEIYSAGARVSQYVFDVGDYLNLRSSIPQVFFLFGLLRIVFDAVMGVELSSDRVLCREGAKFKVAVAVLRCERDKLSRGSYYLCLGAMKLADVSPVTLRFLVRLYKYGIKMLKLFVISRLYGRKTFIGRVER